MSLNKVIFIFRKEYIMSNPALGERSFQTAFNDELGSGHVMTVNGTIIKTCVLGLLMALTFAYTWSLILTGFADKAILLSRAGMFGGLILGIIICFAPKNKFLMITTPLYAMCEGLFLGFISAIANKYYPGVAPQAAMGTMFALFGMFFLYKTKLVKCTDTFRMVVVNSTFAIFGIYLLQLILSFFHITIPGIFSSSPIGIAFSIIVVAIASFNLVLDFDFIEKFSDKVPKYFEWYGGFALLVTIVWLYIEILNLLMKLSSRNN